MTRKSLEKDIPPGSSCELPAGDVETPMIKSRMPCQVAKPAMSSSMIEAMPISVLRPSR
jgi:hypothetical protein